MLVSSIGRVIALPGIPYDPSICDIFASHRPPIAIGRVDLRRGSKLGPICRAGRPRMGTEVQKVSSVIMCVRWDTLTCGCCVRQRIKGLVGCRGSPSESTKAGQVGGNDGRCTSSSASTRRVTDDVRTDRAVAYGSLEERMGFEVAYIIAGPLHCQKSDHGLWEFEKK